MPPDGGEKFEMMGLYMPPDGGEKFEMIGLYMTRWW